MLYIERGLFFFLRYPIWHHYHVVYTSSSFMILQVSQSVWHGSLWKTYAGQPTIMNPQSNPMLGSLALDLAIWRVNWLLCERQRAERVELMPITLSLSLLFLSPLPGFLLIDSSYVDMWRCATPTSPTPPLISDGGPTAKHLAFLRLSIVMVTTAFQFLLTLVKLARSYKRCRFFD